MMFPLFVRTSVGCFNLHYVIASEPDPDDPTAQVFQMINGQRRRLAGADAEALCRALDDICNPPGPAPGEPINLTAAFPATAGPGPAGPAGAAAGPAA